MTDEEHQTHRQVHPSWVQAGRITSQTFIPMAKDDGRVSVYDGLQIEPEASFNHYTLIQGLTAMGTVSVSTAEIDALGLPWVVDGENYPEHASIDFRHLENAKAIKGKAQALAERARQRGWAYQPS